MLPAWAVSISALAYLCVLFAVAHFGDHGPRQILRGRARPFIYALGLGVYCTSWTFLGSVGVASHAGLQFFAIYLGPILVFLLGRPLLRQMLRLSKAQNITSVADFVAARYGKNQGVAALVALTAVIGMTPYVALQLKAISASLDLLLKSDGGGGTGLPSLFGDASFHVALVLAVFAAAFGTRQVDSTEHQGGLMLAISVESVVKLVAFIGVGLFIAFAVFDGVPDFASRMIASEESGFDLTPDLPAFLTMMALSAFAILMLPRQFHVMVVENRDERDLEKAAWLFPLYLVLINLFVVPIAIAGLRLIPDASFDRDMTVLALPLMMQAPGVTLLALLGGLSAATAMVIVESVALAIMVSNDLVMPLVLRVRQASSAGGDLGGLVLVIRRLAILAVVLLAYVYRQNAGDAALASIGLLSFAAIAQIGPAFLGGLLWRRGNARGAALGLSAGMLAWLYTMLLPSIATLGSLLMSVVAEGPFGIAALRPTALLGLDLEGLPAGVLFTLGLNLAFYVAGSLTRAATPIERLQANLFVTGGGATMAQNFRLFRSAVTVQELQATVARYLGEERTADAFEAHAAGTGVTLAAGGQADIHLLRFAEHLLSSAIGAASSRLVLSLLMRRAVPTRDALQLLDEASAIQHSRETLQHALDHARQGVTVFNRNLGLVAWNRAFLDIFQIPARHVRLGVTLDEMVRGNAERGIYGPGEPEDFVAARLASFVDADMPFRLRLFPDDRVIEIRTNTLPNGGFVTTYTDVTEAVRAEETLGLANESLEQRVRERTEELMRVNAELAGAKEIADTANASKTRFLAAASHDILQPLNAARLYASALIEQQRQGSGADIARNIDSALSAVEEILTTLLDISRLDTGGMQPEWTIFPIDEVLRPLAIEFAPLARDKGIDLIFVPCSLSVRSDRRLLRRALQNLISNGIKYTQAGRVLVGCRRRGAALRVVVRDTGIGIPLSKQTLVFREFQRLDQAARIASGLGLGLSIVERIGRTLDHKINVISAPGKGATFTLDLPMARGAPVPVPEFAPARETAPLAGMTALVIDNEPAILEGMRVLLSGWGCTVLAAETLKGAQAQLRKGKAGPTVVIADYHLDEGNGIEAITKLRWRLKTPFHAMLVTADRSPDVRAEAEAKDILLLQKPLKPAALRAALTRWHAAGVPLAAE